MPSFAYESIPVSDIQIDVIKKMREMFSDLEALIKAGSPSGRYQAIALTQLELAGMCAIKSITHGQLTKPTQTSSAIDAQSSNLLKS